MSEMMHAYTVGAAAEMLGISTSTLKRWEREEKIPQPKRRAKPPHSRVYTQEDLDNIREIMQIDQIIHPNEQSV
jgi:DNA-binding transcriptional MerR regulator